MFSNIEEPPLVTYSAFSRKEKGTARKISWHFLFTWLVFYLSRRTLLSLTEEHRWTEHTKVRKIAAPPPSPPPKGRGVITEIPMWGGCRLLFASLSVSTIAETLCVLCMPKAFCGLEMCAKMLSELCALCERKKSPASLIGLISSRGCVLFLTEIHRRTEHTGFHRDIKSTDFTEPYSHLWQ